MDIAQLITVLSQSHVPAKIMYVVTYIIIGLFIILPIYYAIRDMLRSWKPRKSQEYNFYKSLLTDDFITDDFKKCVRHKLKVISFKMLYGVVVYEHEIRNFLIDLIQMKVITPKEIKIVANIMFVKNKRIEIQAVNYLVFSIGILASTIYLLLLPHNNKIIYFLSGISMLETCLLFRRFIKAVKIKHKIIKTSKNKLEIKLEDDS